MLPFSHESLSDLTRCALSVLVVTTTAGLLLMGTNIPNEWWLVVTSVMAFHFTLEKLVDKKR